MSGGHPGSALQSAVYLKLYNTSALASYKNSIFDFVPSGSSYPFIVVGEEVLEPFHTFQREGVQAVLPVHVWSRYRGYKEVKDILALVYNALHGVSLTVTGMTHNGTMFERQDVFMEPDGLTRHGVIEFRIWVQD